MSWFRDFRAKTDFGTDDGSFKCFLLQHSVTCSWFICSTTLVGKITFDIHTRYHIPNVAYIPSQSSTSCRYETSKGLHTMYT